MSEETPSQPGWAGTTAHCDGNSYWMFVRDGRWHIHDAYDGTLMGILPLPDSSLFQ